MIDPIIQTLKPECDVDNNVVDAYIELLKVRESISGMEPTTKKFFFNFSFFVQLLLKDYCKNLKAHPEAELSNVQLAGLQSLYDSYADCIVPAMLHYLDPSGFDGHKMKVHFLQERPMQSNTHDCGVYVCKYMGAILNGISLRDAVWEPVLGIWTFQYRIS
ncbi:putative ubiquitin-like-specific protease 1B [Apium graveolens]|uniref:putative ubiquitin-like-specific protease 1B n=1 Tax=Apium graveolens TaxID=4045 RepID=UPI003D7A1D54